MESQMDRSSVFGILNPLIYKPGGDFPPFAGIARRRLVVTSLHSPRKTILKKETRTIQV